MDKELYLTWDFRTIPFFREEFIEENSVDPNSISIKGFQQPNVYTSKLRAKLITYINACPGFVATTLKRYNCYQRQFHLGLCYYTDGEIIFNNFLSDYIQQEDFAIPQLWFEIIEKKNFKLDQFKVNSDLISSGRVEVFNTIKESFQEVPTMKKALLYL